MLEKESGGPFSRGDVTGKCAGIEGGQIDSGGIGMSYIDAERVRILEADELITDKAEVGRIFLTEVQRKRTR